MPIFRADLYIKISIANFDLVKSSEALLQVLQNVSELRNVQMTKVRLDREQQGKIKIEEWYEVTGSINVPEGGKSFWAISKEQSENEEYNFFLRVDRNMEAKNYQSAQEKAREWVAQSIIKPLEARLTFENKSISDPIQLSKLAKVS